MTHQLALNIIATVKPDQTEALKAKLGTIKQHVNNWNLIPFAQLDTVHFARLIVFDAATDLDKRPLPARLALLTNFDAPLESHIRELASTCGAGLDEIFRYCEAYPDGAEISVAERERFLYAHRRDSKVDYVNKQGRTVRQIRAEDRLRKAIGEYLDKQDFSGQPAQKIHRSVARFVADSAELKWALEPPEPPALSWRIKELLHRIVILLLVLLLSPLLLLSLPVFLWLLRRREKSDKPDDSAASAESIGDFRDDEDHWIQNQIVAVGLFKRGLFRRLTTAVILGMTDYAVRHIYNKGVLSGLNTIHFARWVTLDGGKRLFFSSNYDGSLESYMNDFIDKAAWGLNAIFSNGDGFPRTAFLFCGGITDEQAYKRFLPTRQVHSRVWYSAYPYLTTKNIANNAAIRLGLSADLSADEANAWLARFGVGNTLPPSGLIARILDNIRWDRLCSRCN